MLIVQLDIYFSNRSVIKIQFHKYELALDFIQNGYETQWKKYYKWRQITRQTKDFPIKKEKKTEI